MVGTLNLEVGNRKFVFSNYVSTKSTLPFILFLSEFFLFASTQILGIFVAFKLSKIQNIKITPPSFAISDILAFIILLTIIVFLFRYFSKRSALFFKLVLSIAIIFGSQTFFSLFFNELISTILAILIALIIFKTKLVFFHNFGIILAIAGIGAIFGISITPNLAVIILLVLSFYDIIAVYKTKHMVEIAKEMVKSKAIFGIIMPQNFSGWLENLENVEPGEKFMILGSGDIAVPLILIASVAKNSNLISAFIVMLFSFFGLALTHYLFITQAKRKPMAALPPIALGSILGYLAVSIFHF